MKKNKHRGSSFDDLSKFDKEFNEMAREHGNEVRFVTGKLSDSNGNELLCKCGKPGNMIAGKEAFLIRCHDCGWA